MADLRLQLADLIGTPFVYGGRGPDAFDCFGLVRECYRRVHGIELPDFDTPKDIAGQHAIGAMKVLQWAPAAAGPGVVAGIRIGRFVSHCGFLLDEHTMIHAWERTGGVTIVPLDDNWQRRIAGYYRYAG